MKVVSFNVNGIRARLHQLKELVEQHDPDIIGLQEIKVEDAMFPKEDMEQLGYFASYYGQKGYHGVAVLSKAAPSWVVKGVPCQADGQQRRLIVCGFDVNGKEFIVANGYFPQGESRSHAEKFPAKRKFYEDVLELSREYLAKTDRYILMGDFNVALTNQDIGIGQENIKRWIKTGKCSFLPEEQQWLLNLIKVGLQDSFRSLNQELQLYSWFDYRSKGFERDPKRGLRIDLILASSKMIQSCKDAGIDLNMRAMTKPSDHCPVWAVFDRNVL